jgi:hypothetical protein
VDEPDPRLRRVDLEPLGEQRSERRLVDVAANGVQGRPERAQVLEGRQARDVACVQDQVGRAQQLDAALREPPRPARQVRVRDDRDERQVQMPFRKRPSR